MDISEYWATLVSIIIGLGVADLLANFHNLIRERERVRFDPLPLLWAFITLLLLFNFWWAVAMNLDGSRDATVVGEFVLLAISPILLFLMCASVLPRSPAADVQLDMRADWAKARRFYLLIFWVRQFFTGATAIYASGGFAWDSAMIARIIIWTLLLISLLTSSRRVEWVVALGVLAALVWRISSQSVQ